MSEAGPEPLPSHEGQIRWIVDNAHALTRATMIHIAKIVTMAYEGDKNKDGEVVVLENRATKHLSIVLDHIDSPDLVAQIYRAAKSCVDSLNRVAS